MTRKTIAIALAVLGLPVVAAASIWLGLHMAPQGGGGDAGGGANIGGPFTLVNAQGKTVRAADFDGQYRLIYFGYTYCPDICPTTLVDMTRGLEKLAENAPAKAKRIKPIFISVDPQRDDVPAVRAYIENFHPRFAGLTGSPQQVKAAANAFHVFYEKVKQDRPEGEYLVNHSSYIYLLGPDGRYIDHFKHTTAADKLAEALATKVAG
jgi:protein SCO1/2